MSRDAKVALGARLANAIGALLFIAAREQALAEVTHARMVLATSEDEAERDTERMRLTLASARFDYCDERLARLAAEGAVRC